MRKQLHSGMILATLMAMVALLNLTVQGADRKSITAKQAIQIAMRDIGLEGQKGIKTTVKETIPKNDNTPFFSSLINGHRCYLVTFTEVQVKVPWGENGYRLAPIHGLNALVDATSGKLLHVWSTERLTGTDAPKPVAAAESGIKNMNGERWLRFAEKAPPATLLEVIYHDPHYITSELEQIDAYYVTIETISGECLGQCPPPSELPKWTGPVWEIIVGRKGNWFAGEPDGRPMGSNIVFTPDPKRVYYWRIVVDAAGKQLSSSSF